MNILAAEINDYFFFVAIYENYVTCRYTVNKADQLLNVVRDHLAYVKNFEFDGDHQSRIIPSPKSAIHFYDKLGRFSILCARVIELCKLRYAVTCNSMPYFKPCINHVANVISVDLLGKQFTIPFNAQINRALHRAIKNHRMLPWFQLLVTLRHYMTRATKADTAYFNLDHGQFFRCNSDLLAFIEHYGYKKQVEVVDIDL